MKKYVAEKPEYTSIKLVFLDAQFDPVKQNSQVDNLITQKVNSIVMIPFDREPIYRPNKNLHSSKH